MTKTITITDPMQVRVGDKAYFKGCDFGFTVVKTDNEDQDMPFMISTPFCYTYFWVRSSYFDHATREVEEPEWPEDPKDDEAHWYKDSDGETIGYEHGYWYMSPFTDDGKSREDAMKWYSDSLPLTEMKLVPKEEES